jgi:hypothetical protein
MGTRLPRPQRVCGLGMTSQGDGSTTRGDFVLCPASRWPPYALVMPGGCQSYCAAVAPQRTRGFHMLNIPLGLRSQIQAWSE